MHPPILSLDALRALMDEAFPDRSDATGGRLTALSPGFVRLELTPVAAMTRPGNLVSGPTQMAMADHVAYALILAHCGPLLMAVTHTLTINFLRPCRNAPVIADARFLKLGRRLATIDVRIWQASEADIVAQASVGYALPAGG